MKMIWIWLILIVGILLIGSVTIFSKNQPLLEEGFKEIKTFVYGKEEKIAQLPTSITINPIKTNHNGNYKVRSKTGNESLYDVAFTKEGNNTLICLEAGWDKKEIKTYKDEEEKEIDMAYNYSVPSKLSFHKDGIKQSDLTKTKDSELSATSILNPNKFCYLANPEEDYYLKFGDNSVIIIQSKDVIGDSILSNITAESGDANFTHLNISTTAPYDDLVGYWSFDGDNVNSKGNTSYDFSKENNDGTMVADAVVNSTDCVYDDCLQLDGTGDYVDTPYKPNGIFTVNLWVNLDDLPPGGGEDLLFVGAHDNNDHRLYFGTNGAVPFTGAGDTFSSTTGTHGMLEDIWYMVTFVGDGSNATLYVNVVQRDSYLYSFSGTAADGLHIGQRHLTGGAGGAIGDIDGTIDEVMIFNVSLTTAQILEIYNNQSARFAKEGTQQLNNQSYLNFTTGGNRMNVTIEAETNFRSNISLLLGYYDGSWSFTEAQNLTKLNATHYRGNFSVGATTKTNWTLNFTFYAGNNSHPFYTPLIKGDIEMENWSIAVADTLAPTYSVFANNASSDTTNNTDVQLNVTISDGTAIDFFAIATNNTDGNDLTNQTLIDAGGATSLTAIFNESIDWFPITGGILGWQIWANDTGGYSSVSAIQIVTIQVISVTCDCPSSGNWDINDGSICKPTSDCNIGTNKLRIDDGGLLIDSGINVRTGGCYVADQERLFIEDGGGLYCG